jgi:hypothetical protein
MVTPQPGDFAVLPIQGQVGKLISIGEWLDGSGFTDYDHAVIYVGGNQTMGAYPGGAALETLPFPIPDVSDGWLWSTGHITLSDVQRTQIVANALACKNIPYSALDYFALAAHRLDIPVPGLKHYIGDTGHLICSQLVDLCYDKAGVHLFNDERWPGYVTPANLADVILHPDTIVFA